MQVKTPILKSKPFWTFAIGIAVGSVAVAGFHSPISITSAIADPTPASQAVANIAPQNMAILQGLDQATSALAQNVERAVVNIRVQGANTGGGAYAGGMIKGEGSGVIFRPDGYIITNDHVVDGMDKVTVVLNDGRRYPGKVIRSNQSGDIAVVKINATGLPSLQFANSDKVNPGQFAMAVGSPMGLSNSVSFGHVSALERSQAIPDPRLPGGLRYYPDMIQTDAAINPGNSGGALVNIYGQVIGINTAIESQSGGSQGLGFAIPANQARLVAEMLIQNGTVKRAFMGVDPEPMTRYQETQLGVDQGAYLKTVESNSPAGIAGLRNGDVVTQINNTAIKTYMDLRDAMFQYAPGSTVTIHYVRDGKTHTAQVKLTNPPKMTMPTNQPGQGQPRVGFPNFPNFPGFPQGQMPFNNGQGQMPMPGQGQPLQSAPSHSGPVKLGAEVSPITSQLRQQFNIPAQAQGAVVLNVIPGSVGESIGLQPGDVIESFNNTPIRTPQDLMNAEQGLKWGDNTSIKFQRWTGGAGVITQQQSFPLE